MAEGLLQVFFYGLFMDAALLVDKGVKPRKTDVGFVEDFALRIGRRATMERLPGSSAYGVLMTITAAEAASLYAEPSVADYRPEPVTVRLVDGGKVEAVSYTLPNGPDAGTNKDYAEALLQVAERLDLPASYCETIRRMGR